MKIGAVAPWFGSKRRLASKIVAALGRHRAYWEPFAGGLSVLLAKPVAGMETVNDLHGDLVNLVRCVQHDDAGPALFSMLARTSPCEAIYDRAVREIREKPAPDHRGAVDVSRARDYFVASWLGRNGVAGTESFDQGFCRRFTGRGGSTGTRFASAVESIPAWWERLRGVAVLCMDAIDLIDKIEDASGTAVYCDPPYVVKGARYVHDFDPGQDFGPGLFGSTMGHRRTHEGLSNALGRFRRARVVVSYYNHPLVRALYPESAGWRLVACPISKSLANQNARGEGVDAVAPEVLIVNDWRRA